MSVIRDRTWVDRAACRGMGPGLFHPELGEDTRPAKEVCQGCPVRAECYAYSLEISTHHGIWGGKSERERRGNRPERQREPEPIRHGTNRGYTQHVRREIPPCFECRRAHNLQVQLEKERRLARGGC